MMPVKEQRDLKKQLMPDRVTVDVKAVASPTPKLKLAPDPKLQDKLSGLGKEEPKKPLNVKVQKDFADFEKTVTPVVSGSASVDKVLKTNAVTTASSGSSKAAAVAALKNTLPSVSEINKKNKNLNSSGYGGNSGGGFLIYVVIAALFFFFLKR